MKIRLALLDKDQFYLNRIVAVFSTKYADKFEIYSFTNKDTAISSVSESRIDILLVSDVFDIDVSEIPKKCGFAYLVNSSDVETYNDQRAICKFQKADLIYKQILSLYSEIAGSVSGLKFGDDSCKVIAFASPSGGTGSSSVAAACALHYAAAGKKTLYLNLEHFGSADVFFTGEGQFDMSDVIFALKSKNTNFSMKLESCVKQDLRGVYFYSASKIALDMLELNAEDKIRLLTELKLSGSYSYIILDTDFGMDNDSLNLFRQTHALVWVGDGSEISNCKIARTYEALATVDQSVEIPLTNRLLLVYNKFSNKTGKALTDIGITNIGGAPRYEHAGVQQILEQLAPMQMFDKID